MHHGTDTDNPILFKVRMMPCLELAKFPAE